MDLELISEILGWTSVAFYISITIFNTMKVTRYAAFGSVANDVIWAFLMGWWPKVILNLSVGAMNTYRYVRDFTQAPKSLINTLAALTIGGIGYISYFAIKTFISAPTLPVALQFADLFIIVTALSMKSLTRYRILMLISGFVGFAAYYGNMQMMIIKAIVIGMMIFKLLFDKSQADNKEAALAES